jgi:hypothetical protein
MSRKNKTILFIALPLMILVFVIAGYYMKTPGSIKSQTDYQLSSRELNREFINNDSLATVKYSRKIVELNGAVANIKTSETHGTILTLDDAMMGVKCVMDSTVKDLAVVIGDTVTIKGICIGSDQLIGVLMNQCIITSKK